MRTGLMKPGFILTLSNVTLGLTEENSSGFKYIALKSNEQNPDELVQPKVKFTLGNKEMAEPYSISAIFLMDTGMANMTVQSPQTQNVPRIPRGKDVVLAPSPEQWIAISAPQLHGVTLYKFKVIEVDLHEKHSEGTEDSPTWVVWNNYDVLFVNTGRYALTQFDYLFDSHGRRLGFRMPPTQSSGA